jgi:antitoxin ChpS
MIMATARLRRVGGSIMLPVPPAILDLASLQAGSMVEMSINSGVLEIKPARPRYTMDELLATSDYSGDVADREWLDAPASGGELL